jgi:hypothetical protein
MGDTPKPKKILVSDPFEALAGTWTFGDADTYVRDLRAKAPTRKLPEKSASGGYAKLYALQGSLRHLPLEKTLRIERAKERRREAAKLK